jgi:small basic protein
MDSLKFRRPDEGLFTHLFNDIFEENEFVSSFIFEIVSHVYMVYGKNLIFYDVFLFGEQCFKTIDLSGSSRPI